MEFQTQVQRTLRLIHQKGSERLVKDELCMNLTAVLKSRIFSGRCHFRSWVFPSNPPYEYFYC